MPIIVFEQGGHVHVFRNVVDAGSSIEAMDVEEDFYPAAFSSLGERMTMIPHGLPVEFLPTGEFNMTELKILLKESRYPEAATDPESWALKKLAEY